MCIDENSVLLQRLNDVQNLCTHLVRYICSFLQAFKLCIDDFVEQYKDKDIGAVAGENHILYNSLLCSVPSAALADVSFCKLHLATTFNLDGLNLAVQNIIGSWLCLELIWSDCSSCDTHLNTQHIENIVQQWPSSSAAAWGIGKATASLWSLEMWNSLNLTNFNCVHDLWLEALTQSLICFVLCQDLRQEGSSLELH